MVISKRHSFLTRPHFQFNIYSGPHKDGKTRNPSHQLPRCEGFPAKYSSCQTETGIWQRSMCVCYVSLSFCSAHIKRSPALVHGSRCCTVTCRIRQINVQHTNCFFPEADASQKHELKHKQLLLFNVSDLDIEDSFVRWGCLGTFPAFQKVVWGPGVDFLWQLHMQNDSNKQKEQSEREPPWSQFTSECG